MKAAPISIPPRLPALARRLTSRAKFRGVACGAGLALLASVMGARSRSVSAPSYLFGGRVFAADSGSLEGIRVVATDYRGSYEAVIDSSGMFVGSYPAPPVGRVTLRVFSDSAAPRYHTSVIALGPGIPDAPTRVVVIPRRWRIRGGEFHGREVDIDPVAATARHADASGFWRLTKRGRFSGRAVSWAADSLPVRVAFRRERDDPAISEADSIGFWALATRLERLLGRSLFRPASHEDVDAGGDGIFVAIQRGMPAAGRTFITYDQTGCIYEALVTVGRREYLSEPRVATHELLHAIGLGHTRAWPSVMGPHLGSLNAASVEDVAYAQLYYAISELQRRREAPFGIPEAAVASR